MRPDGFIFVPGHAMKYKNSHKTILLLMIMSQLLLTVFVAYWLRSQYHTEKERLTGELYDFYAGTQDEMIDTILFRSYVNPVLSGQRYIISGKESQTDDTIVLKGSAGAGKSARWNGKGVITVNIKDIPDSVAFRHETVKSGKMTEDMVLRSVRLIVKHAGDSSGTTNPHFSRLALDIDTTGFRERFVGRMKDADMVFLFAWHNPGPDTSGRETGKYIFLNPLPGSSLPEGVISEYNSYLLMAIYPQIFFGLLLVSLTALAFLLSYRSIREHIILNKLRNEFISNISHELRTPVATLSVALESLGKYNLRNEPHLLDEYLKLASLETKRLEELINRVLDHSLTEGDNHALKMTATDINTILSGVAEIMRPRAGKGIIRLNIPEDPIIVKGDPLFLKGVIINLIDNSIKYCDKEPLIELQSYRKGSMAIIEVNDNGPGIPEEYHRKIFEKFFRIPSSNVHNVKGYGLGLSFAAHVITLHGGSVEVKNLRQGCSFIISLPAE